MAKFLYRYPEFYYALFLTAGIYKADPRLSFVPKFLDLTVFFEVMTILVILYNLLKGRLIFGLPPKEILISYIFIIILGILSLSYTLAPICGTDKILRFLFITWPSLFFPITFLRKKESYIRFSSIFIILSLIMSFDIIRKGLIPGEFGFREALGTDYLGVGRISGFALLLTLTLLFIINNNLYKICLLPVIPLFILNLFISGGRGPLVSLILSVVLIFIYMAFNVIKYRKEKIILNKKNLKIISYMFLMFFLSWLIIDHFSGYFRTIYYRLSLLENLRGDSVETRLSLYNTAINSMRDFPRNIIGLGIGGFSVFYSGYDAARGVYPHNIFLEIGAELGILGLLAFIFIICKIIMIAFNNIKNIKLEWVFYTNIGLLASLVFMLINASISGDINDNRLFFAVLGLILGIRMNLNNER